MVDSRIFFIGEPMISILFWNVAKNADIGPNLKQLALSCGVDVFFLAEVPDDLETISLQINSAGVGDYLLVDQEVTKIRSLSRLPPNDLYLSLNSETTNLSVWSLGVDDSSKRRIHLAVVHLPSKAGGITDADQQGYAEQVARELCEYEDRQGCQDTILLGDMNMNPFDPGMVIVSGFHALMTMSLAKLPDRKWNGRSYRRFYNPMWGLFGDRTPGPAATHYWQKSIPSNHHWHMFDQVLLRPSVADRLAKLEILDSDGSCMLVDSHGKPTREHISDHLPLFFQIDI